MVRLLVGEHFNHDHFNDDFKNGTDIPPEDMRRLYVHVAMMDETSSFEAELANFAKKYVETYPLAVRDLVRIFIGRGANKPQVLQARLEEAEYDDSAMENYLTLKGRCVGEDLYRRLVTELFQNSKGEYVVKQLLDKYSRLSHVRGDVELVEDTDTTYTELDYDKSKLKDVLDFIAKTADKAGVIGYDYRIAYDGKFEFFARGSKNSSISLTDLIKHAVYRKTVHRIRNRIYVFGKQGKLVPGDGDAWTEDITCVDGTWSATNATISRDATKKFRGAASIRIDISSGGLVYIDFTFKDGKELDCRRKLDELRFMYDGVGTGFPLGLLSSGIILYLYDLEGRYIAQDVHVENDDDWHEHVFSVGKTDGKWVLGYASFDWRKVKRIRVVTELVSGTSAVVRLDNLYSSFARFGVHFPHIGSGSDVPVESITDPSEVREFQETDEELGSEAEVLARAYALLDWLKDPAENVTAQTEILDLGNNHLQPGDMQPIVLPNENINGSFRVLSIDYRLGEEQELPVTIELGKETPLLADYLYRLRKESSVMARLKKG